MLHCGDRWTMSWPFKRSLFKISIDDPILIFQACIGISFNKSFRIYLYNVFTSSFKSFTAFKSSSWFTETQVQFEFWSWWDEALFSQILWRQALVLRFPGSYKNDRSRRIDQGFSPSQQSGRPLTVPGFCLFCFLFWLQCYMSTCRGS